MIQLVTKLWARYNHINWALIDQAMVSGVNFFTGILLARYLGIEEFGRFTLVWMTVLFVNSIQHSAIISPMMSIGPKQSEAESSTYFGSLIVQVLVFASSASLLLFAGFQLVNRIFPEWNVEGLGFPLAVATFAVLLQDFLRRYFFTREQLFRAFVNDAIRYLGQLTVLIALFLSFKVPIDIAAVLWVIAALAFSATVFGAWYIAKIEINRLALQRVFFRHLRFSKWLVPASLMAWTTGNFFIIMAGVLLGTTAVGALRAAQSLMGVVNILFEGLENTVAVRSSRYFHQLGKKALGDYLKKVIYYGGGATAVLSLVAISASNFWLGLVFGPEYGKYGFVLQWFAVIFLLIFLSLPLKLGIRAIEEPKAIFWIKVWATLFSLTAAYPMIKYFGLLGVVSGIATIHLSQLFFLWVFLKRKAVF